MPITQKRYDAIRNSYEPWKAAGPAFDLEGPMAKMIKRISIRLIKDESGAGMVEYSLLVALIGVVLVGTLVLLQQGIDAALTTAVTAMGAIAAG